MFGSVVEGFETIEKIKQIKTGYQEKLGWETKISLEEMVHEMMENDINIAKRDSLIQKYFKNLKKNASIKIEKKYLVNCHLKVCVCDCCKGAYQQKWEKRNRNRGEIKNQNGQN
mgnify:CR=1 FL=1